MIPCVFKPRRYFFPKVAIIINTKNRIVIAEAEQIQPIIILTSCFKFICINKSADCRIVIPTLEVIESRLGWVFTHTRRACSLRNMCFSGGYQLKIMLCTGKHRRCDTTTIVRIIPETLRAWDYPNDQPFVPKRRCLQDNVPTSDLQYIHFPSPIIVIGNWSYLRVPVATSSVTNCSCKSLIFRVYLNIFTVVD